MREWSESSGVGVPKAMRQAVVQYTAKGGWILSSHIAMSMMLALFPFLLFVVALAGTLSQDLDIDDLIKLIFDAWPQEIAAPIVEEIRTVLERSNSGLMTISGVLTLYFASNGVDAVREAVTRAYSGEDTWPFWKARLLCLVFVLIGSAMVLGAVMIGVAIPLYLHYVSDALPSAAAVWVTNDTVATVLAMASMLLSVTVCHLWLPATRMRLSEVWPGILLTVALWLATAQGFSLYMSYFATYSATYAGLAGAMAALIFLNLMASILILGAEFNSALIGRSNWRRT